MIRKIIIQINAKKMQERIGFGIIDFQEKIIKRFAALRKNPVPENFTSFNKFFKDECFRLYRNLDAPFLRAIGNENARAKLLKRIIRICGIIK